MRLETNIADGGSQLVPIQIPTRTDSRGSIGILEDKSLVSFEIKRVYYLYGVPEGESRGGHAHRRLEQLLIAVAGAFVVRLHDGRQWTECLLSSPTQAIQIAPMTWRELVQFSDGAVCLVLASQTFEESDYIRNFSQFIAETQSR